MCVLRSLTLTSFYYALLRTLQGAINWIITFVVRKNLSRLLRAILGPNGLYNIILVTSILNRMTSNFNVILVEEVILHDHHNGADLISVLFTLRMANNGNCKYVGRAGSEIEGHRDWAKGTDLRHLPAVHVADPASRTWHYVSGHNKHQTN